MRRNPLEYRTPSFSIPFTHFLFFFFSKYIGHHVRPESLTHQMSLGFTGEAKCARSHDSSLIRLSLRFLFISLFLSLTSTIHLFFEWVQLFQLTLACPEHHSLLQDACSNPSLALILLFIWIRTVVPCVCVMGTFSKFVIDARIIEDFTSS